MNKIFKFLILSLSISVTLYALVVYSFLELGVAVHPGMKSNFQAHPIGIYLHIFSSLIALAIGPFQFYEKFRLNKIHVHRLIGKIYLISVLIGGLSGLFMSQYSFGGMISHSGFCSFDFSCKVYQSVFYIKVVANCFLSGYIITDQ